MKLIWQSEVASKIVIGCHAEPVYLERSRRDAFGFEGEKPFGKLKVTTRLFLRFLIVICISLYALPCSAERDFVATDTTAIPAKWKNESVVILNYEYSFTYAFYYGVTPTKKSTIHIIYYVRDKWGVEALSRINLPSSIEGAIDQDNIGTVHKVNGTQVEISKDQLIPRKEKINFNASSSRRSLSLESEIDQKLAVPSLEVGDILELNIVVSNSNHPDYILLVNKFPMLHFEATVSVTQPYSYASSVLVEALHVNSNVESSEYSGETFKVTRDSVDKYKSEILADELKEMPYVLIRFKVTGQTKKGDYSDVAFGDPNKQSKENLHLYLARQVYKKRSSGEKKIAREILSGLLKKHPIIKDSLAYIKDAYYLYREIIAKENLYYDNRSYNYKEDRFFACVLSRVLFKQQIDHRIFLSQPDHYSVPIRYSNFVGVTYGVSIPGKDLYLFNPLYSYDPENIPSYFEDQKFYSFSANKHYKKTRYIWYFWAFPVFPFNIAVGAATSVFTVPAFAVQSAMAKKNRKFDLVEGKFPTVKPEVNQIVNEISISKIDLAAGTVLCESQTSCYGKMKISESKRICSASSHFLKYNNAYRKLISTGSYEIPISNLDTLNLKKRMKHLAENDIYRDGYALKKLISHNVVETNFFDASKPFIYSVSFSAKNLVAPFEDYIVLHAGNFIGRQLAVPEDTSGRENNFYIPFSKQLVNRISIKVPEGYAIENLKDFNVKNETAAGTFSSEASLSGNTVLIVTKKIYGFRSLEEKSAPEVYGFLSEAEKFYDKKMIFQKLATAK